MMIRNSGILCALLILAAGGCESFQSGAPAVTPAMVAGSGGGTVESLEVGRRLLATRCTSCHSLIPITKFPAAEWPSHVAEMADRANLTATEQEQITTYLVAARRSTPASPSGEGGTDRIRQ